MATLPWSDLRVSKMECAKRSGASEAYRWLACSKRRRLVVASLIQPMTAAQLSKFTRLAFSGACEVFGQLRKHAFVQCLNVGAVMARVHGLTAKGLGARSLLFQEGGIPESEYLQPDINWDLYGRVCTVNRGIVVLTLTRPMQPCQIKRRALVRFPHNKMTNSNVRGVVRELRETGIVEQVWGNGTRFPQYQLTPTGHAFQALLARIGRAAWGA